MWGTQSELKFIDGLGSFCAKTRKNRKELLESYLRSAEYRCDWGNIDKAVVIDRIRKELGE